MKISILLALLVMPTILFAESERRRGGGGGSFGEHLTAEQRACMEDHGCPSMQGRENMSDAERAAARECRTAAMEACGIERPERRERGGRGGE